VRDVYVETLDALRRRELPTRDVGSFVRLTKSPERYRTVRESRRELAYEALIACGRTHWAAGDKIRVYRTRTGAGGVIDEDSGDPRDYDIEHYVRVLRETFAARLGRAFSPEDCAVVFADPDQLCLFAPEISGIRPVLR
jgi:hypothetical protein